MQKQSLNDIVYTEFTLRSALVLQIIDGPGTIVFLKKIKVKRTLLIYILQNIVLSEETVIPEQPCSFRYGFAANNISC